MLAAVRAEPGVRSSPTGGASADVLAVLRRAGACFRSELAAPLGPAADRGRRGPLGPGGPGHGHRRRLLGGAVPAAGRGRRRPAGRGTDSGPAGRPRAPAGAGRAAASARAVVTGARARRPRSPDRRRPRPPRSWPRRWPGSCWPAGAWWPGSCGPASPTGSPGATWSGPSGGWRPGARSWAAGSWPGVSGEQYALPEAASLLAEVRRDPAAGCRGGGGRRRPAQPDRCAAGRRPDPGRPAPHRRATAAGCRSAGRAGWRTAAAGLGRPTPEALGRTAASWSPAGGAPPVGVEAVVQRHLEGPDGLAVLDSPRGGSASQTMAAAGAEGGAPG